MGAGGLTDGVERKWRGLGEGELHLEKAKERGRKMKGKEDVFGHF